MHLTSVPIMPSGGDSVQLYDQYLEQEHGSWIMSAAFLSFFLQVRLWTKLTQE